MRRALLAGAAAAVVLGVVVQRPWTSTDTDGTVAVTADVATEATPTGVGPRSQRFGVPQGWSRDERGARAAAVSAVGVTGEIARAGFVTRADMIGALTSARFAPVLARDSAAQLDELLGDMPGGGVPAEALLFRELPLTARVVHADAHSARVLVWAVLLAGAPDRGAPRQLWRTVTVDLVWEHDDWRVDGWTAAPGPTPALATNAAVATVAELVEVTGWSVAGGR